jgi:hypothetical protein
MSVKLALIFAWTLLFQCSQGRATGSATGIGKVQVSERPVRALTLNNASLQEALAVVARESGLGIGLEEILKDGLSDPPRPEVRFSAAIPAESLSHVLDDICNRDGRYTWAINGHTINVFPKKVVGDGAYFLNRRIGHLVFDKISDSSTAVFFTMKQLPGPLEQIAMMQTGGSMRFPTPLKADLSDVTVREALNRIAEQFGEGHGWTLSGAHRFRFVQFQTTIVLPDKMKVAVSK